jgi:flavoprotein
VSENEYLVITPANSNANWNITFNVENTLSTNYDVCAIVLPATVYNPKAQLKSCRIQAEIIYVDENGAEKTFNCNNTKFSNDPASVDTLVLAEDFKFPVCNYDQTNNKIKVKLKCNILPRESSQYSREMFLDCIYLRPRKNTNSEQ